MPEPAQILPQPLPPEPRKCSDCGTPYSDHSAFANTVNCCDECQRKRFDRIEQDAPTALPGLPFEEQEKPFPYRTAAMISGTVVFLTIAGFLSAPRIERFLDARKERQLVQRASDYFAKGDLKHAVLDARSALDIQPRNVEANRIIAKALETLGSPDAILWRKRLDSIASGDPENSAALAKASFIAGDIAVAEETLDKLKPEDRSSPLFHEVAAGLAMSKDDTAAAERHSAEAVRLNPNNDSSRMQLALLRIKSSDPDSRASAIEAFEELRSKAPFRSAALRALIEDAMNHERTRRARELVDELVACPEATFHDRVWRLSVLRAVNDSKSAAYLNELNEAAASKPEQLTQLFDWMNRSNLALMVSDFAAGLPPNIVSKPPVAPTVADAYVKGLDWKKLKAFSGTSSWGTLDFMRLAYLSRALGKLGETSGAENEWRKSLAAAQGDASRMQLLVKLVQDWKWEEGTDDALRRLSADDTSPLWMLQELWNVSLKAGDSEELLRLSNLITKMDPKSVSARNKFVWLSIIRHSEDSYPHQLAEKLFRENKTNVHVATTFALSLYLQRKPFEALAIMSPFKDAELREPGIALYYGMFLAQAGKLEKAVEFINLGETSPLLREEKELLRKVKTECRLDVTTIEAARTNLQKEKTATADK